MDPIAQVTALLDPARAPHQRIAAAVVLGELRPKAPATVQALLAMAREDVEAFAKPALVALGRIGSAKALPVLLDALSRSSEVAAAARQGIAELGPEALPAIRERLATASPELRAALSQLLPSVGGKQSFEMVLQGLSGQPFEAANKVALSVRAEVRTASPAERKAMKGQLEKFLAKKSTLADEVATRAALKILGYLELPESTETLLAFLSGKHPPLVRVEAVTALRFGLREGASRKVVRKLIDLLADAEPLVARAARDSLTVIPLDASAAADLAVLAGNANAELALWVIAKLGSLGGEVASATLAPVASGRDRTRAQAAAHALAALPDGGTLLARALIDADEETGAQVLAEALQPLARGLDPKLRAALRKSAQAALGTSPNLGRRKLEPLREVDPAGWGEALREAAKGLSKKDPARAEPLYAALARSSVAVPDDRWAYARLLLLHSPMDAHPKARQRDPALGELALLADRGYPLVKALEVDKQLEEAHRYFVGFHFAEQPSADLRALGHALLEGIAERSGRTKLGKAAKNKLALLG